MWYALANASGANLHSCPAMMLSSWPIGGSRSRASGVFPLRMVKDDPPCDAVLLV